MIFSWLYKHNLSNTTPPWKWNMVPPMAKTLFFTWVEVYLGGLGWTQYLSDSIVKHDHPRATLGTFSCNASIATWSMLMGHTSVWDFPQDPCMVYLYLHLVDFCGKCRYIDLPVPWTRTGFASTPEPHHFASSYCTSILPYQDQLPSY